jgi:hypothetical protein
MNGIKLQTYNQHVGGSPNEWKQLRDLRLARRSRIGKSEGSSNEWKQLRDLRLARQRPCE